ncbi:MAG: phytanoyl-CoA dioxygenase family protein [Proteobacteria bacterium]|nr:phytanoyl-CoA dioxygenase family protein [Pseudomonadota bacterium]
MWFARTRPGVIAGFRAAYQEQDLTAAFDRMSINLPTATRNEGVLQRLQATNHRHGRLNMQELHTHKNSYYDERNGAPFTDFYSIVPLWDMNQGTGATAVVPRSHKRVPEIQALRARNWVVDESVEPRTKEQWWASRKWVGNGTPDEDVEQYTDLGLTPWVTNIRAGDMVIFDTALYHAGCAAADPTGASGNGTDQLLRAIYIMGMTPTRLKTQRELQARRLAYELDLPWYPDHDHQKITEQVFVQHTSQGGNVQSVRHFHEAPPEIQRLIDPTVTY